MFEEDGTKQKVFSFLWHNSRANLLTFFFLFPLQEVKNLYEGVIKMNDSGTKIKVDQMHVETVIPAPGKDCWLNLMQYFEAFGSNRKVYFRNNLNRLK